MKATIMSSMFTLSSTLSSSPPPNCSSPSTTSHSCTTTNSASINPFPQVERLALLIDKSKSVNQLLQIHAALIRHGLDYHPILNFKLQRSYSSAGRLDYSITLFDRTQEPNVFFWTSIIHGHIQCGLTEQAFQYYVQMLIHGVQPNAFTLSSILRARLVQPGKAIHCQAIKFGYDSDLYVRTGLVDGYARGGDVVSARQLFDTMPEKSLISLTAMLTCYAKLGQLQEARVMFQEIKDKDVVCWNVIIDGYAQHGFPNESLSLFRKMLAAKVKPNELTMLSVLSACAQVGALESGKWVHSFIKNNGIRINIQVATALVDMYCKCGSLDDARLVFDNVMGKDVVACNAMIVGYAMHGYNREAFQLFKKMCRMGHQPTDITFIGLLTACGHAGLVTEGWKIFNSMKDDYQIQPKIEHYGCMVNLLGRAGHLEEAYELVRSMEIEPDPVLWGTLLGACRLHGNVSVGEKIAEFLLNNKIANSGTYVLLSNMYAATGNWDGVARMRKLMKETGVEKEPGCSSIEIGNRVHEFLAGDLRHPRSKEIYEMLEEISSWLKAHNYVPQTNIVLHDLEERQKEQSLQVHSEKLAMAYGLISTRQGTTIKIVKNLRVCLDCHAVMKLISKITGRRIIMRDRNRFHHFEDGNCSCKDFW